MGRGIKALNRLGGSASWSVWEILSLSTCSTNPISDSFPSLVPPGYGVCRPHQGVHHSALQPLWPCARYPSGDFVEVQSAGEKRAG